MVTLSIESVLVDDVLVPTPAVYSNAEVRLFPPRVGLPSSIDLTELWLHIQVDSTEVYWAAFR